MKNEERLALLKQIAKKAEDEIRQSIKPDPHIMYWSKTVAGERVTGLYCQSCGHEWDETRNVHNYYCAPKATCPCCGETKVYKNNYARVRGIWAREDDSGAIEFADFNYSFGITHNDEQIWYKNPLTINLAISHVARFSEDDGFSVMVVDGDKGSIERRSTRAFKDMKRFLLSGKAPLNMELSQYQTWTKKIEDSESAKDQKQAARNNNSKRVMLDAMREGYKCKTQVSHDMLMNAHHEVLCVTYNTNEADSSQNTYLIHCTKCGHEAEIGAEYYRSEKLTCPVCGTQSSSGGGYCYHNSSEYQTVCCFEKTSLPEEDLLIRVFSVTKCLSATDGYSEKVEEGTRIFCSKKISVYRSDSKSGNFYKGTLRDLPHSISSNYHNQCYVAQSNEEIVSAIQDSCLRYSGLIEAWGMGDPRYEPVHDAPKLNYLVTWYKRPNIEKIMKINIPALTNFYLNHPESIGEGKTLAEALVVPPFVAKMVTKHKMGYQQMCNFCALYNADNSLTYEVFEEIDREQLYVNSLTELRRGYGIPYRQAIEYMETVYNHQCINKNDALHIWADYLRMAKNLKMDLRDKTRMYPSSLKKEHDVAVFAYKAVKVELDKEQFAHQAEENAYYEYSYKDLQVIVPRTPEEIVEEATRQRNCLRSYVERVKNGNTVVAFIRYKENLEDTFLTAEINNGNLIQLKGYCNANVRNSKINEFVQHWAKAKGITIAC